MFPNPLSPNVTYSEAQGYALGVSYITVSQGDDNDTSQSFLMSTYEVRSMLDYARSKAPSENDNTCNRKLAIGLGLTLGLGILITYIVTWAAAQWWARREVDLYGVEKGLGARRWWVGF